MLAGRVDLGVSSCLFCNEKKSLGSVHDGDMFSMIPRSILLHWVSFSISEKDAKEIDRCKWMFVVTELFNIAVNIFGAMKIFSF